MASTDVPAPTVRRLDATLGAVVTDVDLSDLGDDEWDAIHRAFLEHAVLVFPDQHLDAASQREFGLRFGGLEAALVGARGVVTISNQDSDGSPRPDDDPVMAILRGNEGWHTDSSYMPIAAKASILSAQVVPATGGETEWADMRASYALLDPSLQERLGGLAAYHSLEYSQARAGEVQEVGYGIGLGEMPLRPLVKVHPETDRPALFIGRHAHDIVGLDPAESEQLLDGLLADACRPPRTYRHTWTAGDVVVWDNRCVLHRAHPYDYREIRVMRHTRVAGDPASEGAVGSRPAPAR